MNTQNHELTVNENSTSPSTVVRDRSRANAKKTVNAKAVAQGYNDQNEFFEIDPFTGRIRTFRHN